MDISLILFEYILLINVFLISIIIFLERRNPTSTWAWLMVLSFLPLIGFILYILFGRNFRKRKIFSEKQEKDKNIKFFLKKEEKEKKKYYDINDPIVKKFNEIITLHYKSANSILTNDNKVRVFNTGREKFESLLKALRTANSFIHLEYYIFRKDTIGQLILEILEDKAKNGVEVKLLYDAIGAIDLNYMSFKKLKKYGGEVIPFFPSFFKYINFRINYRNHRKIAIIDGKIAFIGGFNIGDEYLGYSETFQYWRDTHIKIKGSAVSSIERQFILDWSFSIGQKAEFKKKYFPEVESDGNVNIQIVSSGPDSTWSSVKDSYFKIITSASKYVYIETPYFIPDESILQAIKIASLSGIDVKIVIPGIPDHRIVFYATLSYLEDLLMAGVEFYMYNKGFLHSKVILSDDMIASVGTANFDMRSFNLNFEINAFIYDKNVVLSLKDALYNDIINSIKVNYYDFKNRGKIKEFIESLSRLFSPLL